jgi:hypothetical protein
MATNIHTVDNAQYLTPYTTPPHTPKKKIDGAEEFCQASTKDLFLKAGLNPTCASRRATEL